VILELLPRPDRVLRPSSPYVRPTTAGVTFEDVLRADPPEPGRSGEPMPDPGRNSRDARLLSDATGVWGTSSQDFVHLAGLLYRHSDTYAGDHDGNVSPYALAGIPMLFSAIRCLLIELADGVWENTRDCSRLKALAASANDVEYILSRYTVPDSLAEDLRLLVQLRHELLHPSHRPAGTSHNTPAYLESLRQRNLLQSTGTESDYIWIDQLKSHRLFQWASITVETLVDILLTVHSVPKERAGGIRDSYRAFQTIGVEPPSSS